MKSNKTSCCGTVGPKRKINVQKIPDNPVIENGIQLIFLGSGAVKFKGKKTGQLYYAAGHRRHITVVAGDEIAVLSKSEFILQP